MFDFFKPSVFAGIRIVESPEIPRYTMPEWLVPPTAEHDGVRWSQKLRDETNRWALRVCGTTNHVPFGSVYMLPGGFVVMRPQDVVKLQNLS